MTHDEKLQHAKALQNNPLLPAILNDCRQSCFQRWESSPDTQTRELAWVQWQSYNGFQAQLDATIAAIIRSGADNE